MAAKGPFNGSHLSLSLGMPPIKQLGIIGSARTANPVFKVMSL